jgi:predicted TPR repeat methyltransferase
MTPMADALAAARERFLAGTRALQAGDAASAAGHFEASLQLLPDRVSTLVNLAAARLKLDQPEAALALLERALAQDPQQADVLAQRGVALAALGRDGEALAAYDAAWALCDAGDPMRGPLQARRALALLSLGRAAEALRLLESLPPALAGSAETLWHRGRALQALERLTEAEVAYRQAVSLQPDFADAWGHLGGMLKDGGRLDEAAACLRRACELDPLQPVHRFLLASIEGRDAPPQPPPQYVQALFDGYADGFEAHLVQALEYRAPQLLMQLLQPALPVDARQRLHALDLGCGSGLLGELLAPRVAALDGVDLSPRMLERARARGCYRRLHQAEVVQHLLQCEERPSLITATDVFIYIGDLAPVFAAVARVLPEGGLFAFSVERLDDGGDHRLLPTSRYGHGRAYLQRLAAASGLNWRGELDAWLRREQRQPVPGLCVLLQRAAGPVPT